MSFLLTPDEYTATVAKIEKINNRAVKRGFTGRIEVTGAQIIHTEHDEITGRDWEQVYFETEVTGEAPCYGDWQFLAAVDALPAETGEAFVLRLAPGLHAEDVDRDVLVAGRCEHCGIDKNTRIYTYLVRNIKTNEVKQVGSTCIQDFTGWHGRPVFISTSDVEADIEGHIGGGEFALPPIEVITIAYAAIRLFGWVPATAFSGVSTRQVVSDYLYRKDEVGREIRQQIDPLIDEGKAKSIEIVRTLTENLKGANDYELNLVAALKAIWVTSQQFGLVVSAVSAYDRLVARQVAQREKLDRSAVAHQGVVGSKITLTGIVTQIQYIHGDFGTSLLIVIESADAIVKTFTTAKWSSDVEVGQNLTLTGTVKRHEFYNGAAETILSRCKVTS